jgi:hypothetical protein
MAWCSVEAQGQFKPFIFHTGVVQLENKLSLCLTKHHARKTYWGIGGIAPRILDLGTRWR